MIRSMTGFGKAETTYNGRRITVEIKSVNHRFLDVSVRLPAPLSLCEQEIRKRVGEVFQRGKIDIFVKVEGEREGNNARLLELNLPLLDNYYAMLREIKERLNLPGEITLTDLTGLRDIFIPSEPLSEPGKLEEQILEAMSEALEAVRQMRHKEGENLRLVMETALALLKEGLDNIVARAPQVIEEYRMRLMERIRLLTGGIPLDEGRLMQEVALLAEKSDITEEVDRMRSHLSQFSELLQGEVPEGRKLDFLVQEMSREVNTMGAKSNDLLSSKIIIDLKGEVAKLKEQVQNIE